MASQSAPVILRGATRADLPALAVVANAANANSEIHRHFAPRQNSHPICYYKWRLMTLRKRFVDPDKRIMVAVDAASDEILGLAVWQADQESSLKKRWESERAAPASSSWGNWVESKMLSWEGWWNSTFVDRSIDPAFLRAFLEAYSGSGSLPKPPNLGLNLISVPPTAQGRRVGTLLVDWGKRIAKEEGLPIFLEANLEAPGFYEKGGFRRMEGDWLIEGEKEGRTNLRIPVFVWDVEGDGALLEKVEGLEGRWRWKEGVLKGRGEIRREKKSH